MDNASTAIARDALAPLFPPPTWTWFTLLGIQTSPDEALMKNDQIGGQQSTFREEISSNQPPQWALKGLNGPELAPEGPEGPEQ